MGQLAHCLADLLRGPPSSVVLPDLVVAVVGGSVFVDCVEPGGFGEGDGVVVAVRVGVRGLGGDLHVERVGGEEPAQGGVVVSGAQVDQASGVLGLLEPPTVGHQRRGAGAWRAIRVGVGPGDRTGAVGDLKGG